MFSGSKKPYTAVTAQIERLTSEDYLEDDASGIFDLVEVIRIQPGSGATEAARALRKKLKYGNSHRQIRALVILDSLLENGGTRFQRAFVDEPLLERLRLIPQEEVTDPKVREKCRVLFIYWANSYKNTAGLDRIANLYKELPKSQRPQAARRKVLRETENPEPEPEPDSPHHTPTGGRSRASSSANPSFASSSATPTFQSIQSQGHSSKLSKSKKSGQGKPFNLAKEKDKMTTTIAQASIASTNLLNSLQLINRETERVSMNAEVVKRLEACKTLRRRILYYIQNVESDDWIGGLVNANDELVKALIAYEITDRSIEDDSDSDAWEQYPEDAPKHAGGSNSLAQQQLAGLSLDEAPPTKPPRPSHINMPAAAAPAPPAPAVNTDVGGGKAEDDDPFGDDNAAPTPYTERPGMTWREV